jgi:hypothetical protein
LNEDDENPTIDQQVLPGQEVRESAKDRRCRDPPVVAGSCPSREIASPQREILLVNGGYDVLWAPVWDRIDEHLEEIRNFLRCPTVSASDDDMVAGAEYVAALIEGAGESAEIILTAGHPAVLGQRSSQVGGDDLVVEERASSVRWQQHGCAIETSYRP